MTTETFNSFSKFEMRRKELINTKGVYDIRTYTPRYEGMSYSIEYEIKTNGGAKNGTN